MLFGGVISELGEIDGALADGVIGDGVLVHDLDLEDVIGGVEVEGLVPDGSFPCLVLDLGLLLLLAEGEDAVGVLGGGSGTILEKNSVSCVRTAFTTLTLILIN